jgi:hypothetical protein
MTKCSYYPKLIIELSVNSFAFVIKEFLAYFNVENVHHFL